MIDQTHTLYAFETEMFEQIAGLSLAPEEPLLDPDNPILEPGPPGAPDEAMAQFMGTILPHGGGYMMWYPGRDARLGLHLCHAFSADGLSWERRGEVEGLPHNTDVFSVFRDRDGRLRFPVQDVDGLRPEHVKPAAHRAMLEAEMQSCGKPGSSAVTGFAVSDDGIHWRTDSSANRPLVPMKFEAPRVFFFRGRYVMCGQSNGPWTDTEGGRRVAFFTSDDLARWERHPKVFTNDSWDGQTHCGIVPVKRIDDRLLIGLGGRFDDGPDLPDMHFDITLLYSYDGLDWRHVVSQLERRSWIRRGRPGDWDFGGAEQGDGLIELGDEALVYYGGSEIGNLPPTHI